VASESFPNFPQYVTEKFYVNLEAGEDVVLYSIVL